MKKGFMLFVAMVASGALWAADFEVDGIAYNKLGGDSVEVTEKVPEYEGNITVPASVTYGGKTYRVTSIGGGAFGNCLSLQSVSMPNSIQSIGYGAFQSCLSMSSITIPHSVRSIGEYAFQACTVMTTIFISDSVVKIGDYAFSSCRKLETIEVDPANKYYHTEDGILFNYNQDTLIQYPIGNKRDTYTIPSSVKRIETAAFAYSRCLVSVVIPNTVEDVGYNAFLHVTNIINNSSAKDTPWGAKCVGGYVDGSCVYTDATQTVLCGCPPSTKGVFNMPNSVTSIEKAAFYDCDSLTEITLSNSLKKIGDLAFYGCRSLGSVDLPATLKTIGSQAYYYCANLKTVDIPDSVSWMGTSAFGECTGLTSVTLPNRLRYIPSGSFRNCRSLTEIVIPETVEKIEYEAFMWCSQLSSVNIPNSVTSIGYNAFCCSGLTSITLTNHVTEIGFGAFSLCGKLSSFVIPDSIKTINTSVFGNCTSLASVTIPNSVKTIDAFAFDTCSSLTAITLPASVTSLGSGAFRRCVNLSSITCLSVMPPKCKSDLISGLQYVYYNSFFHVDRSIPVYVLKDSMSEYAKADVWKEFVNILPISSPTGVERYGSSDEACGEVRKVMTEGKLRIRKDGGTYDVLGRKVE